MSIKNIDHPKHLKEVTGSGLELKTHGLKSPVHLTFRLIVIWWKFPFTNNTRICLLGGIGHTHSAELTTHLASAIFAKEKLHLSRASAWCASVTHFTLGVRSACKRNFQSDYSSVGRAVFLVNRRSQNTGRSKNFCTDSHLCCVEEVLN